MNTRITVVSIAIAIIAGGAGFWSGVNYAGSKNVPGGQFGNGTFVARNGQGGAGRMSGVVGTIVAKDSSSITVQLGGPNATSTNGTSTGTRIVFYSTATQVEKTVAGAASDLTIGQLVAVGGTPNADGSITASTIQLRAAGGGFGRTAGQ